MPLESVFGMQMQPCQTVGAEGFGIIIIGQTSQAWSLLQAVKEYLKLGENCWNKGNVKPHKAQKSFVYVPLLFLNLFRLRTLKSLSFSMTRIYRIFGRTVVV